MSSSRDLADRASGLNPPIELTANRTMTDDDSGKSFVYNGTGAITLTFPLALSNGFKAHISNAGTGSVVFSYPGRVAFGNASRGGLNFQWDVADVECEVISSTAVFNAIYNLALPVLFAQNTAQEARSNTTLTAMAGMSLPLEVNAAYDVDIVVPYTSSVTTESLKLGVTLPNGAVPSLQIDIFVTNTSGTSNRTGHFWPTAALAASGTSGSASVVGQTLMAHVWGKVRTGATAGNLIVTAGARDTSGTVTIAANAASMSVSKVYDQGRT